ncbi:MAG TPA: energy transducer TonB, partial [Archangium sp.]
MFQSVINQPGLSAGRFGTGVWVSLMVHAGVLTGAIGLSGKAVEQLTQEHEIVYRHVPQPPRGNPNPPKATVAAPAKPKPPKKELVQPRNIPPPPPEKTEQVETPPPESTPETAANDLPYVPGSHPDGVET